MGVPLGARSAAVRVSEGPAYASPLVEEPTSGGLWADVGHHTWTAPADCVHR
jgi:hypothetical protein